MTNSATEERDCHGASGGSGGSIAKRLAKDGFSVVVNTAGTRPKHTKLSQIRGGRRTGHAVQAMWANAATWSGFSRVDGRFRADRCGGHCAGIMPLLSDAGRRRPPSQVIATNLRGTFMVFAQAQNSSDGGRIMASPAAFCQVLPDLRCLQSFQGGSRAWVTCLQTNCVAETSRLCGGAGQGWGPPPPPPPPERTCFLKGKKRRTDRRIKEDESARTARLPEDMANLVSFLAGPEGGWINLTGFCC